jgi:ATP/ADP translocase
MKTESKILGKLFSVHPEEYAPFGSTAALMFLILLSQIFFANYADTAFIKRFGVEYLPEMFVIDAVLVFFVMDLIRTLAERYSPTTLLTRIFVIFAAVEILCRFVVLFDFSLLYPFMFILRQQFDGVILIIFWNLCNDVFDTRQSKRIFPLITAGGILGRVLGSFSTDLLSRITVLDNLLLVSAGILLLGIVVNRRLEGLFSAPMVSPKMKPSGKKAWSSPIAGFKEMSLLTKGSLLFVILATIRILPNIVAPMFDYQFSVIVAERFPSETELARFYGIFRGVLNIITFVVLMFIGKVHTKVGIPNALLFRPGNFFFVFSLLLFRFDILVGIYGRISIAVFTSTLHNPANNILVNLFPDKMRVKARPILQMASRIGSLLGSGILVALKAFLHASLFSIFGIIFSGVWVWVTLSLKRKYTSFVLESVLEKQVDLTDLQDVDLRVLVQDQTTRDRLLQGLREEKGEAAVLCARILSEAAYPKLGEAILSVIREKELPTRVELFNLIPAEEARPLVPRLVEMAERASPWLLAHLVGAVGKLAPKENIDFLTRMYEAGDASVRAEAMVGLYHAGLEDRAFSLLSKGLESSDAQELRLTINAVARAGETRFGERLHAILEGTSDPTVQASVLDALGCLELAEEDERIARWLESPDRDVRRAAVSALAVRDEKTTERVIEVMGDESAEVRDAALEKIRQIGKGAAPTLLRAFTSPKRKVKEGILQLLEDLEVKDVQLSEVINGEIRRAYEAIYATEILKGLNETPALGLLLRHLDDKKEDSVFTVFRILEVQGEASQIRPIYKGLRAGARDKANAIEALETILHPSLSRTLLPLVEDIPMAEKLKVASTRFGIDGEKPVAPSDLITRFLGDADPMTQMCALYVVGEGRMEEFEERIKTLQDHPDPRIGDLATRVLERMGIAGDVGGEKPMLSTMDKIIHLKKVYIFSDLQVGELAAIGSVAMENDRHKGEIVVKEGEAGDTMFLILSGSVSVIQNQGTKQEKLITTLAPGDYFGEMALFEEQPRSATVKTDADAKFLVLGKLEFEEIMREFPQIAINICRVFSRRARETQRKFLS